MLLTPGSVYIQTYSLVVDQYLAKADISADIWYFSNIGIGEKF